MQIMQFHLPCFIMRVSVIAGSDWLFYFWIEKWSVAAVCVELQGSPWMLQRRCEQRDLLRHGKAFLHQSIWRASSVRGNAPTILFLMKGNWKASYILIIKLVLTWGMEVSVSHHRKMNLFHSWVSKYFYEKLSINNQRLNSTLLICVICLYAFFPS